MREGISSKISSVGQSGKFNQNISRWNWLYSLEDAVFTSWAPGYPRNISSQDDCTVLRSSDSYKWVDIRYVNLNLNSNLLSKFDFLGAI